MDILFVQNRISLCDLTSSTVKGIFSDSNNIFLWHANEYVVNKKSLIQKFQLISMLCLQVAHDHVYFIGP